jgi:hypothetical protein
MRSRRSIDRIWSAWARSPPPICWRRSNTASAPPAAAAQWPGHSRCRREYRQSALADHFGSLEALQRAGEQQILEVPDIGPVIAAEVHSFFADRAMCTSSHDCARFGLQWPEGPPSSAADASACAIFRRDRRADRQPREHDARAGRRAPGGAGRQGQRLGVEENQLCDRRLGGGLQAGPRPRTRRSRYSTRRAWPGSCCCREAPTAASNRSS